MSDSFEQTIVMGHLGSDPELRSVPSGDQVCNFSVAASRRFRNRDGDKKEETNWYKVTVWGKQAENCAKYLTKGRKVLLVGRVTASAWKNRDGEAQASLEINPFTVQFLSEPKDSQGRGSSSSSSSSSSFSDSSPHADSAFSDSDENDDDIPF